MPVEFKNFMEFVHDSTNLKPPFWESFQDICIHVPCNKDPPKKNMNYKPESIPLQVKYAKQNTEFLKLVKNPYWEELEDYVGASFMRFCFNECIFAKKTKNGAYLVPSLKVLDNHASECCKENSNLENKRTELPEDDYFPGDDLDVELMEVEYSDMSNSQQTNVSELRHKRSKSSQQKQEVNPHYKATNTEISTDCLMFRKSSFQRFSKTFVLDAAADGKDLFADIMAINVGQVKTNGHMSCVPLLAPLLEEFKKSHKRFRYFSVLDDLLKSKSKRRIEWKKNDVQYEHQISIEQLNEYFRIIFHNVIPKTLFGCNRNRKIISKAVADFLKTARTEVFDLKFYIQKLKISEIHWLDPIDSEETKWSILAKFVKWFFIRFIMEVLKTQVYTTLASLDTTMKIYFRQGDWQRVTAKSIRKMKRKNAIEELEEHHPQGIPPIGRWMLFPKATGVRSILSSVKYSRKDKKEAVKLLRFLQQVDITSQEQLTFQGFYEKWKKVVEKFRESGGSRMYLVSCDVNDAYGSIMQNKLYEILLELYASVRSQLEIKEYEISSRPSAKSFKLSQFKQYFADSELELPIPKDIFFSCVSGGKSETVDKEELLSGLKHYIFNQKVEISNVKYLLRKGLPQGGMLSAVLCDIYYGHMHRKKLADFEKNGTLFRYVDDFLYVTQDEAMARKFLELTEAGIKEYNCRFSHAKTKTNLQTCENTSNHIVYLGYSIDGSTLEVKPKFPEIKARYTTKLNRVENKSATEVLQNRLSNITCLKLNEIVLDRSINSKETILSSVKSACIRQAGRCLSLIQCLFDNISENVIPIYKIIKKANAVIFRTVRRHYTKDMHDFEDISSDVRRLLWLSYKEVFPRKPTVYKEFRGLIVHQLNNIY